jgi:hypothetical protein
MRTTHLPRPAAPLPPVASHLPSHSHNTQRTSSLYHPPSTTCSTTTRGPGVLVAPGMPGLRPALYAQGSTATPSDTCRAGAPGTSGVRGRVTCHGLTAAGDQRVARGSPDLQQQQQQQQPPQWQQQPPQWQQKAMVMMNIEGSGVLAGVLRDGHPRITLIGASTPSSTPAKPNTRHNPPTSSPTHLSCDQKSVVPSLAAATHSRQDPSSCPLLALTRPPASMQQKHNAAQRSTAHVHASAAGLCPASFCGIPLHHKQSAHQSGICSSDPCQTSLAGTAVCSQANSSSTT